MISLYFQVLLTEPNILFRVYKILFFTSQIDKEDMQSYMKAKLLKKNGYIIQIQLKSLFMLQSLSYMGKQSRNEALGRVYREFSRQKYNKYKAQFPKLRESQIVAKIIKEWDAFDLTAKEHLQKIYQEKHFLTNEDISSSEALQKADRANNEARIAAQKQARAQPLTVSYPATRFHSNIKQAQIQYSDFNRKSEVKDDSRLGQSSSPAVLVKSKQIAKASQSDYITFFKGYYKNLSKLHPRWTTQQIASVSKLQWKKRKNQGKSLRKTDRGLITSKTISGRRYFRKVRRHDYKQANIRWRLLPYESKIFWDYQAAGETQPNKTQVKGKVTYRSASVKVQSANTLEFMRKVVS